MRSSRFQSAVSAETRTLPRTSDGQNGAVAVVGNLNKSISQFLKRFSLDLD
jgi:hypothetical protein